MSVVTNWSSQPPTYQSAVVFDLDTRELKTYDGNNWVSLQHHEPAMFTQEEQGNLRKFLDNYNKYERLIKEHYPEDYL